MPKVTSKDGTIIAYDKKGEGPVVILVLGALNKRGSGKKLMDLLKDKFTVVSYDRRGRGDSTDTLPYSTHKEVEDLDALITELGGKAYLYGHSSGAILALLTANALGDKVEGLALYELPYNAEPGGKKAGEEYRKELRQLLAKDNSAEAVSLFIMSVGVSEKQMEALKKLPMWKGLTAMAPTLAYDTIELMEDYPTVDVKDVHAKALVMYGADSPAFMGATAEKLSKNLPHAEIKAVEGQNHDVKADVLAPILATFFNN